MLFICIVVLRTSLRLLLFRLIYLPLRVAVAFALRLLFFVVGTFVPLVLFVGYVALWLFCVALPFPCLFCSDLLRCYVHLRLTVGRLVYFYAFVGARSRTGCGLRFAPVTLLRFRFALFERCYVPLFNVALFVPFVAFRCCWFVLDSFVRWLRLRWVGFLTFGYIPLLFVVVDCVYRCRCPVCVLLLRCSLLIALGVDYRLLRCCCVVVPVGTFVR
jgi:hypothetical protein